MEKSNSLMKIWNYPINGRQVYFIAFLIYFLPTFLSETTFVPTISNHWLRIFTYLSLPFLLFKIFVLDRWQKKELLVILLFLIFGLVIWRTAHYIDLLMIIPFIIGAKDVNFREIVRWYFYLTVLLMSMMIVFSLIKIIPNIVYYSPLRPTRFSLGMLYPSVIAAHYLFLVMAYCYLRFGRLNIIDYLLIILGDFIVMLLTNTRLDFLATLIVVIVMFIAQRAFLGKKWAKVIASFWWMFTPILAVLTIFASYFYNPANHLLRKINSLSSGRLVLGHQAFERYSINLFGRTITEHSFAGLEGHKLANNINNGVGGFHSNYFYIDSSYIRMILLWGLLAFIIIIFCVTFIALRSTIQKTFILSAIILVSSLSFMFEPHVIQIIYNPFILALMSNSYFNNLNKENKNAKR